MHNDIAFSFVFAEPEGEPRTAARQQLGPRVMDWVYDYSLV
jgi:hypothetical protein